MKQVALLFTLFLTFTSSARENPFQPIQNFKSEPLNKPIPSADFEQKIISVIEEKAECKILTKEPKNIKEHEVIWKQDIKPTKQIKKIKHKKIIKKRKRAQFKLIYSDENLKIYTKSKYIKIITKEKIQKSFSLKAPYRLVIDFKDDFFIYNSLSKKIKNRYIKELRLGTHDCFFRLTFVLKSNHSYRVKKINNGYLIKLR